MSHVAKIMKILLPLDFKPHNQESMKRLLLSITLLCTITFCLAQNVSDTLIFAFLADTHIGSGSSVENLTQCVADINAQPHIQFAIFAGDVTEFGSDKELALAKDILSKLNVPYYIIPGNHDTKWSESGCNTFNKVFGASRFSFTSHGMLFVGSNSGPNMRMGNAQVPREEMVWLDSLIKVTPKETPIIYVVHNPMDNSLTNWDQVFDILRQGNLVLSLGGHWHSNTFLLTDGVPNILGRAVVAGRGETGYNIVKIDPKSRQFQIFGRVAGSHTEAEPWKSLILKDVDHSVVQSRPDYSFNDDYPNVQVTWQFQDNGDIGSGFAFDGSRIFYATAPGEIKAISATDGQPLWVYPTGGRIYSFPYYSDGKVVCASTDGSVYGLDATSGELVWRYKTEKGIVACPLVYEDDLYIGSSCGKFYALDFQTGKEKWVYTGIENFIEARPYADEEYVYIGSWGNEFYALNRKDGALAWKWINGPNRNLSAAANFPVESFGKIFITTPERITRALDKHTGAVVWEERETKGRESQGLSPDKKTLYIKTMLTNELVGLDAQSDTCKVLWRCPLPNDSDMDLAPAEILANGNAIFVPSSVGKVYAVSLDGSRVLWAQKISNTVINHVLPISEHSVVVSTMDGVVACLSYTPTLTFAVLSDTHLGSFDYAWDDINQAIDDINRNPDIAFVVVAGDITEFGTDKEIEATRSVLERLSKEYLFVPGNHDTNWSENGCTSFDKIMGGSQFSYKYHGILFLGISSGPYMRMGNSQAPREDIEWLRKQLAATDVHTPIVFVIHAPLGRGVSNSDEIIDLLKTRNIQLVISGHTHNNRVLDYEGIPGVTVRSNLRREDPCGGYTIVTIENDQVTFAERRPCEDTLRAPWGVVEWTNYDHSQDATRSVRRDYATENRQFSQASVSWMIQDESDIASGATYNDGIVFYTNTIGQIKALDAQNGKTIWTYQTDDKIFSEPTVYDGNLFVGSTDRHIYCLNALNGALVWKCETSYPVLATPMVTQDGWLYVGGGNGNVYAIDAQTGQRRWTFEHGAGYIEARAVVWGDNVYIGCWGAEFYAINRFTGALTWKYAPGLNRYLSPGACWPVVHHGKVFVQSSDKWLYCFDANSGDIIWKSLDANGRESIGLSPDGQTLYVKSTRDKVVAIDTQGNSYNPIWETDCGFGSEVGPTRITATAKYVYIPTANGQVYNLDKTTGKVLWRHHFSPALISSITVVSEGQIVVTTMDGKVFSVVHP